MIHPVRFVRFLIAIVLVLAGCASPPKPPPPTIVQVTVIVAKGVNPDSRGRPSPIVMRMFELKSLAAFEGADFFSLFDKDRETLGGELVAREELQLSPGDQRKFDRLVQPDTRYVAVIAAFRDLEHSQWRASAAVPLHKTTPLAVRLDAGTVSVGTQ